MKMIKLNESMVIREDTRMTYRTKNRDLIQLSCEPMFGVPMTKEMQRQTGKINLDYEDMVYGCDGCDESERSLWKATKDKSTSEIIEMIYITLVACVDLMKKSEEYSNNPEFEDKRVEIPGQREPAYIRAQVPNPYLIELQTMKAPEGSVFQFGDLLQLMQYIRRYKLWDSIELIEV